MSDDNKKDGKNEVSLVPVIDGFSVPIRSANETVDSKGNKAFAMWMCTEVGTGTIGDSELFLAVPLHGGLVVQFDGDYKIGRFYLRAKDFIEAAYEVYLKNKNLPESKKDQGE